MEQEKIGKFIAELRKEKKMTQDDLAQALYTDRSIVSKWERGLYVPKYDIILKLSDLFEVTVNEIYYGERQNDKNKSQVNQVTINIIKDNKKKVKKLILFGVILIVALIISFLVYYFINTYNSISVYKVTGESEKFGIYDGIIVVSREKSYIQLGDVKLFNNIDIKNAKLYYKKNNKDYIIFSDDDTQKLLINNFKHSELFSYSDLKYIKESLYLEIEFSNNQKETIKLKVQKDFTNNNIFTPDYKKITNDELIVINIEIPEYIKENFTYDKTEEKYYLKESNKNATIIQTYYVNANLYIVEEIYADRTLHFEYFLPNDISYDVGSGVISTYIISENKCTSNQCEQKIIDYFIDRYLNKIFFQN